MKADSSGGRRIGIIAGNGTLPLEVVRKLVSDGENPFVLLIKGEAAPDPVFEQCEHVTLPMEHLGLVSGHLKRAGVTHLVLAGGVAQRPRLGRIRWTPTLILFMPHLIRALGKGDDALLRALIGHVEAQGITIVGADEIVADVVADAGYLTQARPNAADRKDIAAGLAAARAIGALDIGQAAVAVGGRAIALEGIEGTDGLLERTIELRSHGRLAGKRRGVLVKCSKPDQELRVDLPAIGPRTIEDAHAGGLAGIAVEAGRSLILSRRETIDKADELGLFIVGLGGDGA